MTTLTLILALTTSTALAHYEKVEMFPPLAATIDARLAEFDDIPKERRDQLAELAAYVRQQRSLGEPARLTFICTHNSRRSHMAQLWAAVAAAYYGVEGVETFSGGTEATAFNPRAVAALRRAGLAIDQPTGKANPRYQVAYAKGVEPLSCFSKVFDESPNPSGGFCAVMTCSQADQACPVVAGAQCRLAIPYDDPKAADDTPQESLAYDQRCAQIAREMLYAFSLVGRGDQSPR